MKKILSTLILFFLILSLQAEENNSQSNALTSSDWLHLTAPACIYITSTQTLQSLGMEQEASEYCVLTISLLTIVGKEYYDYRFSGASTWQDLELGVLSVITGYYTNKAINAIFRSPGSQSSHRSQKRSKN